MEKEINKKRSIIEKGPGFKSGIKDFTKGINSKSLTIGTVSAVWGAAGPCLIVMSAATAAGFNNEQTVSWIFGILFFAGCIGVIMPLYYKIPISGGFSIPGASMLATSLVGFTFNEASFAFIAAGIIVLLLGLTGLIGKVMRFLPLPIVMGMILGVMLRFGTGIATSTVSSPLVAGSAVLAFFLIPRIIKKASPMLCAIVVGIVVAIIIGEFKADFSSIKYIPPQIARPSANFASILSVSIPLAALVIGAENSQGMGCLRAQGYNPPVNAMTAISGVAGICAGIVGAHNANIAGPMTCMNSSSDAGEDKKYRYPASVICGTLFIIFGLLGSYTLAFLQMFPPDLMTALAGLAMINVLMGAVKDAFGTGKCMLGAMFAFFIGASGITIVSIGAAFWGLVGGVLISLIAEKEDFDHYLKGENLKK